MTNEPVWIHEGHVLDDAGNLIVTTYIDARENGKRTAIPGLVRGSKREHALEDGATILVSKPARFREHGEALILDVQEGLAKEESLSVPEETPTEATRQRAIADMNEARELLEVRVRHEWRKSNTRWKKEGKSLSYGDEWWIFCASIMPRGEDRERWRATLPDDYDHVSEIGQPAMFAQALAHMVTEQVGPLTSDARLRVTAEDGEVTETKHRLQWVVHGPVIYTNRVYETLTRDGDDRSKLAAKIFTKDAKYADQREYRFAVLNQGATAETTVSLKISGMMRDALRVTQGGLIRGVPAGAGKAGKDEEGNSVSEVPGEILLQERNTVTDRRTQWEEWRSETRGPDGVVESSDRERRERGEERIVERIREPGGEGAWIGRSMDRNDDAAAQHDPAPARVRAFAQGDPDRSEEEVMRGLAMAEGGSDSVGLEGGEGGVMVCSPTGRTYKSIEEMLRDPSFPVTASATTWQEAACSPEEVAKSLGALENLAHKVTQVKVENRRDAASACWHAVQCIRNIHARLGDIVDSIGIERERFVVIRLRASKELLATGRIVISPSGSYAYRFRLPDSECFGSGEVALGVMFYPMDQDVEKFEEFGWARKVGWAA